MQNVCKTTNSLAKPSPWKASKDILKLDNSKKACEQNNFAIPPTMSNILQLLEYLSGKYLNCTKQQASPHHQISQ